MNNAIAIKTVYAALYSLLQTVPLPANIGAKANGNTFTWQRTSRNPIDWDKVSSADQPMLLLHGGPLDAEQKSAFRLPTWTMRAYAWIYFRASSEVDPAPPTEDTIMDIFDAINNTLQPVPGELQTLAGTIYHAYTLGCMYETALEDNQVLMLVPIEMRTGV